MLPAVLLDARLHRRKLVMAITHRDADRPWSRRYTLFFLASGGRHGAEVTKAKVEPVVRFDTDVSCCYVRNVRNGWSATGLAEESRNGAKHNLTYLNQSAT